MWEMGTSKLLPDPAYIQKADNLDFAAAFARIECHYFVNAIFLEEAFILNNAHKIKDIPVDIVQVSGHDSCLIYPDHLPTTALTLISRAVMMSFVPPSLLGSCTKPCHKASW